MSVSPFTVGQPAAAEEFFGRGAELEAILARGAARAAAGKPAVFFIEGEAGIGKSSFAGAAARRAEREHGLRVVYAPLGAAKKPADLGAALADAAGVVAAPPGTPFGVLAFLRGLHAGGIGLVLDEIDALARDAAFAHFLKDLVDANAVAATPVPMLLVLCGVEECRRRLTRHHPSLERLFQVIRLGPFAREESTRFLADAFTRGEKRADANALALLVEGCAGYPKVLQMAGDSAFWIDADGRIDAEDARATLRSLAVEVGSRLLPKRAAQLLADPAARRILARAARRGFAGMAFDREKLAARWTPEAQAACAEFLRRLRKLDLADKDGGGALVFTHRFAALYAWWQVLLRRRPRAPGAEA